MNEVRFQNFMLSPQMCDAMLVAFCLGITIKKCLWFGKKLILEDFYKKILSGKETLQILVFQIICEFQTATNIAPFI